jgi:hypothetical protein
MKAKTVVNKLLEDDIPGGSDIGERHDTSAVDPKELALGKRVEGEHTDDPRVAEEIALDHLAEKPNYYSDGKARGMFPELADT